MAKRSRYSAGDRESEAHDDLAEPEVTLPPLPEFEGGPDLSGDKDVKAEALAILREIRSGIVPGTPEDGAGWARKHLKTAIERVEAL